MPIEQKNWNTNKRISFSANGKSNKIKGNRMAQIRFHIRIARNGIPIGR